MCLNGKVIYKILCKTSTLYWLILRASCAEKMTALLFDPIHSINSSLVFIHGSVYALTDRAAPQRCTLLICYGCDVHLKIMYQKIGIVLIPSLFQKCKQAPLYGARSHYLAENLRLIITEHISPQQRQTVPSSSRLTPPHHLQQIWEVKEAGQE